MQSYVTGNSIVSHNGMIIAIPSVIDTETFVVGRKSV